MSTGDKVLLIVVVGGLAIGLLSMLVGWIADHLPGASVKNSGGAAPVVMSRTPEPDRRLSLSSLQTDSQTTSDRQTIAKPTEQQMLDIFKALRAAGVKREAIAGPWRAAGLPLDTNLWSKAAPSEKDDDDDTIVTPWAGRRTKASYYDDPRLEYQQPPN
jgi:hypothetical protein